MPDLDEMKQIWAEYDRKLDASIRLNRRLLSAAILDKAQSQLQRMTAFLGGAAMAWCIAAAALGRFFYQHLGTLHLSLSAAALDLYAIGMLATAIRQMAAVRQVDYDGPVALIQKQLENLRLLRIRSTQRAFLAGTIVWAPFGIVACKALLNLDVCNAAWLWANIGFGLFLIPLTFWFLKQFGSRIRRSTLLRRLMDDIAGPNLNAAMSFLAQLSQFEAELPR